MENESIYFHVIRDYEYDLDLPMIIMMLFPEKTPENPPRTHAFQTPSNQPLSNFPTPCGSILTLYPSLYSRRPRGRNVTAMPYLHSP